MHPSPASQKTRASPGDAATAWQVPAQNPRPRQSAEALCPPTAKESHSSTSVDALPHDERAWPRMLKEPWMHVSPKLVPPAHSRVEFPVPLTAAPMHRPAATVPQLLDVLFPRRLIATSPDASPVVATDAGPKLTPLGTPPSPSPESTTTG